MIITTSMPALVLAMVMSGAIPAGQVHVEHYAGNGAVASAGQLQTDTPWLDADTRLAVAPAPGYLESDDWKRFQQKRQTSEEQKGKTA
jgi:hypothetical protein